MFTLDTRLEQDTQVLGDFPLSRLLLMKDAQYPWFILVPRREEVSEVFQLSSEDQHQLWAEAAELAEILKDTFAADKMNIASLGNMVPQLHVHVIARRKADAAWPAPVWGKHPAKAYTEEQIVALRERLALVLPAHFVWSEA